MSSSAVIVAYGVGAPAGPLVAAALVAATVIATVSSRDALRNRPPSRCNQPLTEWAPTATIDAPRAGQAGSDDRSEVA